MLFHVCRLVRPGELNEHQWHRQYVDHGRILQNWRTLWKPADPLCPPPARDHGMSNCRIVVTGMGLVTPLGTGVEAVWKRLVQGRSGITRLPEDIVADLPGKVGGRVPLLADDVEAGWAPDSEQARERTATIIASGIGGFGGIAEAVRTTDTRGPRRLSPFTIPSFLVNLAAGHVSIQHGFKGPLGAPVTACAAGVQAIGDAARMIRCGEADIAICGGAEAAIDRVSLAGFAAARALSSDFNDTPERASRPFDRDRDGFVMGEGAGILVIESLEHALARGATPIVELVGYGTSADAYHLTAGPEDGSGARRSMETAIRQAA